MPFLQDYQEELLPVTSCQFIKTQKRILPKRSIQT